MPKRSIEAFDPIGRWLDGPFYSDADIDDIIRAAGRLPAGDVPHTRFNPDTGDSETVQAPRRIALQEQLESAARNFVGKAEWSNRPTPKQRAQALQKIENAATKLLKALYVSSDLDPDSIPAALRHGALLAFAHLEADKLGGPPEYLAQSLLRDALLGVGRLQRWANAARLRNEQQPPTPRGQRHKGAEALDEFFGSLAGIWMDVFEGLPARSVGRIGAPNEGIADGPFVRFVEACLRPILGDATPSRDAIGSRVKKLFPSLMKRRSKKSTLQKS